MGYPPPTNYPPPTAATPAAGTLDDDPTPSQVSVIVNTPGLGSPGVPTAGVGAGLGGALAVPPVAVPCGFTIGLPRLSFSFQALLALIVTVPTPSFHLALAFSCDLSNPVSVSSDLAWGAGRASNAPPNPDDAEWESTY